MRYLIYSSFLKKAKREIKNYLSSLKSQNKNSKLIINSSIINNLDSYLNKELEKFILPTFALEINLARIKKELKGKNSHLRYKDFFVKKAPIDKFFFSKYPQLENFLFILTNSTIKSTKVCLDRLINDWGEITKIFSLSSEKNNLLKIKIPPNSDRHHQGQQTLILEFNNNFLLVYKPYQTNSEKIVYFISEKINKTFGKPLFKTVPFLDKNYYSYRLFIDKDENVISQSQAKKFYYQAGGIIALSYILNATDLHMDNLVVNKGNLYLLDTETFFHHFSFKGFPKKPNIFFTGLLSDPKSKSKIGETSGLQGGSTPRLSLLTPFPKNDGTDKICVRYKTISRFTPHNRLYFKGTLVEPKDYCQEIILGFENVYNFFQQNKDLVIKWIKDFLNSQPLSSPLKLRQIIRPTSIYIFFIQNLLQPSNLKNNNYLKFITKKLKSGLGNQDPRVKKLIPYEVKEIMNLNVPYFYTEITKPHLYDEEGNCYKNFFNSTGLEELEKKLFSLSKKDLEIQTKKILSSLRNYL
ncbi:MAG: type 2 lanthipeptide synthetase LanM [Microgenomates group bacterium]